MTVQRTHQVPCRQGYDCITAQKQCKAPDCRLGRTPTAWAPGHGLEEELLPPQEVLPAGPCDHHILLAVMLLSEGILP